MHEHESEEELVDIRNCSYLDQAFNDRGFKVEEKGWVNKEPLSNDFLSNH